MAPCGAPSREGNLARFARNPSALKSAWRVPFAAGVLRGGMNAVAFAREDAGAGRALWCEIDVTAPASDGKGREKRSAEAAPSSSSGQTK